MSATVLTVQIALSRWDPTYEFSSALSFTPLAFWNVLDKLWAHCTLIFTVPNYFNSIEMLSIFLFRIRGFDIKDGGAHDL